jgi:cytochrome c-type biogenesis protein CcmE
MKPLRRQRLLLIGLMVLGMGLATAFALRAFNENLMYFFSPSDVKNGKAPAQSAFRLGGMVVKGSVQRPDNDLLVQFTLSDFQESVVVRYRGILPDLFREGQGIVANGQLDDQGRFIAQEVLAKHDENYMPPEVAKSLKTPATAP